MRHGAHQDAQTLSSAGRPASAAASATGPRAEAGHGYRGQRPAGRRAGRRRGHARRARPPPGGRPLRVGAARPPGGRRDPLGAGAASGGDGARPATREQQADQRGDERGPRSGRAGGDAAACPRAASVAAQPAAASRRRAGRLRRVAGVTAPPGPGLLRARRLRRRTRPAAAQVLGRPRALEQRGGGARIGRAGAVGRAVGGQRARAAGGLAGVADPPAVEDHPVREHGPVALGDERADRVLDLDRVGLGGPAPAPDQPPEVGVDGDARARRRRCRG